LNVAELRGKNVCNWGQGLYYLMIGLTINQIISMEDKQSDFKAQINAMSEKEILAMLSASKRATLKEEIKTYTISEAERKELGEKSKELVAELVGIHDEAGLKMKPSLDADGFIQKITIKGGKQVPSNVPFSPEEWDRVLSIIKEDFKTQDVKKACKELALTRDIKGKIKALLAAGEITKKAGTKGAAMTYIRKAAGKSKKAK